MSVFFSTTAVATATAPDDDDSSCDGDDCEPSGDDSIILPADNGEDDGNGSQNLLESSFEAADNDNDNDNDNKAGDLLVAAILKIDFINNYDNYEVIKDCSDNSIGKRQKKFTDREKINNKNPRQNKKNTTFCLRKVPIL